MNTKGKEFVVSVADFAFYINGVLACTGVTNLSSSISVSMQEQAVNAGKGNKKYSHTNMVENLQQNLKLLTGNLSTLLYRLVLRFLKDSKIHIVLMSA